MLTALIGDEIINCYDGTHTKEQLKNGVKRKYSYVLLVENLTNIVMVI